MLTGYIIILTINLISVFLNLKSKFVTVISLLFLYIMMWGNTYNGDYNAYKLLYDGVELYPIEPGFKLIIYISNKVGLSYQSFLMVIGVVSIILIGRTVRRYAENYSIIFAFYLMSSFVMDTIIIRNTLAMAVVIFALPYFAQGKKMKYFLCIILATLIHVSMLIFLVPLIIGRIKSIKITKLLIPVIIVYHRAHL